MDELITEAALKSREAHEKCAGSDYQLPDKQVLALIQEVRRLRAFIAARQDDHK